ncbi:MAG: DNA-binding protein WhiA [Fervidobacterium sp.]
MRYTFSEEVKGELCQAEILSNEEAQAELTGYLKGKGVLVKSSVDVYILLEVGFIPAARRIMTLMHKLGVDKKKLTLLKSKLQRKRVQIFIPISILEKLNVSILEVPDIIQEDIGLFGAFLRGLFVSTGSVTDPSRHYHLEFVLYNESLLRYVDKLLEKMLGISGKISKMNYNYRYYIKRGRDIQEILELMGATRGVAHFEKILTSREIKGDINRSLNFLSANAKRTGESNVKQIDAINFIKQTVGLDALPNDLKELAKLRLENEDLSLTEIGELFDPPLTKSMVYNRIKKIMEFAERLKNNEERI